MVMAQQKWGAHDPALIRSVTIITMCIGFIVISLLIVFLNRKFNMITA